MLVKVKHMSYNGYLDKHHYIVMCENGLVDEFLEKGFTPSGEYELPDELWNEGSGWADLQCDNCGYEYTERTRPGKVVSCPICGDPELIPEDAVLIRSYLDE